MKSESLESKFRYVRLSIEDEQTKELANKYCYNSMSDLFTKQNKFNSLIKEHARNYFEEMTIERFIQVYEIKFKDYLNELKW